MPTPAGARLLSAVHVPERTMRPSSDSTSSPVRRRARGVLNLFEDRWFAVRRRRADSCVGVQDTVRSLVALTGRDDGQTGALKRSARARPHGERTCGCTPLFGGTLATMGSVRTVDHPGRSRARLARNAIPLQLGTFAGKSSRLHHRTRGRVTSSGRSPARALTMVLTGRGALRTRHSSSSIAAKRRVPIITWRRADSRVYRSQSADLLKKVEIARGVRSSFTGD